MFETVFYYAILSFEALVGVVGIRLYEEPSYRVVESLPGGVEIRHYAPRVAAEITLPLGGAEPASDTAFRALFGYIAGANRKAAGAEGDGGEKIAMTTPVEVRGGERVAMTTPVQAESRRADSGAGGMRMQFFLPARYGVDTAPRPTDPRVRIVAVPAQSIAALRFSGRVGAAMPAERVTALLEALKALSLRPAGEPVLLTYDAPFTIPFLRRNEIAVVVERR